MKLFADHGTKLIGSLTAAVGVLGAMDPAVITGLFGQNGMSYVATVAGILTILRGFQNTKAAPPPPPAP